MPPARGPAYGTRETVTTVTTVTRGAASTLDAQCVCAPKHQLCCIFQDEPRRWPGRPINIASNILVRFGVVIPLIYGRITVQTAPVDRQGLSRIRIKGRIIGVDGHRLDRLRLSIPKENIQSKMRCTALLASRCSIGAQISEPGPDLCSTQLG